MRGPLHSFDQHIATLLARLPEWVRAPMLVMTFFGRPIITFGTGAIIVSIGYSVDSPSLVAAGAIALGTLVIGSLLKLVLRRKRPASKHAEYMFLDTFSFPSGHAVGTVAIFGLIAYLIVNAHATWSVPVTALIVVSIFLTGISRVYLSAHYASDVIGGWLLGLAGLAVIVFAIQPAF